MKSLSSCPICDAPIATTILYCAREDDSLVRCSCCGVVFANPQYEPGELREIYRADYYNDDVTSESGATAWGRTPTVEPYEVLSRALVRRFPRLGKRGTTVMDFGCGVGEFLKVMKARGARCLGIEFSEVAARYVREYVGVSVTTGGEAALATLQNESIDLVSLISVLEHLREPLATMRSIWTKLKPGGVVFLGVPNIASPIYKGDLRVCQNVQNRTHLALYTWRSLLMLLSKSGFIGPRKLVFWGGGSAKGLVRNVAQYFARMVGMGSNLIVTAERPSSPKEGASI